MINLSCPSCTAELEIDDGFRGGVCRCFDCGTLMTVPDAPGAGSAETLSRPDTPDEEVYADTVDETEEFVRTGEFYTSSGRRVHLTSRQLKNVPVARKKRMGVRITVIALMVGIILSIMAGLVTGMVLLFKPPTVKTAREINLDLFNFDPQRNPFQLAESNFLSIPIAPEDSTVMMVDGSAAMQDYLDIVKHAVWTSYNLFDRDQPLQIVFMREDGPILLPTQMSPMKKLPRGVLLEKLKDLMADGGMSMKAAFSRVQRGVPPKQVYLAMRLLPPDAELDSIGSLLVADGVKLVAIHIDPPVESEKLRKICKDTHGKYIVLPGGQLRQWYKQYLDSGGRPLPEIGLDEQPGDGDKPEPDADADAK